jgi:hypothetical protein
MLDEASAAGHRAARVTRQLLAFSRKQMIQPTILDPNAVVRGTERMLRRLIREDVELARALAPDARTIRADSGQLEQVVPNLALNARDAMPQGGKLTIETANVVLGGDYWPSGFAGQPGRYVVLAVSDTGTGGMDEKAQKHIFEPFFTTKAAGLGTGLGLATVYGIVNQSGGEISVYSEPGQGTTFRVYLPAYGGPVTPVPLAQAPIDLRGKETVLFAEDDVAIRMLARQILDSHGYHVLTARASTCSQNRSLRRDCFDADARFWPGHEARQLVSILTILCLHSSRPVAIPSRNWGRIRSCRFGGTGHGKGSRWVERRVTVLVRGHCGRATGGVSATRRAAAAVARNRAAHYRGPG